MALLHEIQAAAMGDSAETGPLLLRLKFLAAKLGSQPLAEWVKHESDGYPDDISVPEYRRIPVSFTGTFTGPNWSGIKNAQIPSYLIAKFAGEEWNLFEARQGISAIEELIGGSDGTLEINAFNLILLLQGKIYKGHACNAIHGTIGRSNLVAIRHAVKSKILDLTLQLEKEVPVAALVEVGGQQPATPKDSALTTQFFQQIVHGNVNHVTSTGNGNAIVTGVIHGEIHSLVKHLTSQGMDHEEAEEAASIVSKEKPSDSVQTLGAKAKKWLAEKAEQAGSYVGKAGLGVATDLLTEAAKHYWGL